MITFTTVINIKPLSEGSHALISTSSLKVKIKVIRYLYVLYISVSADINIVYSRFKILYEHVCTHYIKHNYIENINYSKLHCVY